MLILPTSPDRFSLIKTLRHKVTLNNEYADYNDLLDIILLSPLACSTADEIFETEFELVLTFLEYRRGEEAGKLLRRFPFDTVVKHVGSPASADQILDSFLFAGFPEQCIRYLDHKKFKMIYGDESLIQKKLDVAQIMVFKGFRKHAEMVIENLIPSLEELCSCQTIPFTSIIALNINLSRFRQALHTADEAKRNEAVDPAFYVHLSMYYVCAGNFSHAQSLIEKHEKLYGKNIVNVLYGIIIYNLLGDHVNALNSIGYMIENYCDIRPDVQCRLFIEKGDSLRALGQYEEALISYELSGKQPVSYEITLWVACFEEALTLIYLNRYEDALEKVHSASLLKSNRFNMDYNPCSVLHRFLIFLEKNGNESDDLLGRMLENQILWPLPFMPVNYWATLLIALLAMRKDDHIAGRRAIKNIYDAHCFEFTSQIDSYRSRLEIERIPDYQIHFSFIESVLFPAAFFWKIFRKFNGRK